MKLLESIVGAVGKRFAKPRPVTQIVLEFRDLGNGHVGCEAKIMRSPDAPACELKCMAVYLIAIEQGLLRMMDSSNEDESGFAESARAARNLANIALAQAGGKP